MSAPLLELRGIVKRYGAVEALSGAEITVDAGEVVALVGDNGAGKSTLVKAIAGVHGFDEGEFLFRGEPVTVKTPTDATDLGIASVYQDLSLCENLDVVGNLFLGREETRGPGGAQLDEAGMERTALELLSELKVRTLKSVRTPVAGLSGGQRQTVAISRALLGEPVMVILDEPTAALGVAQTEQVLGLIKRLRDRGLGVLVISHNLSDVFEVADRVVVMRLGRPAGSFNVSETSPKEIVAAMTGANESAQEDTHA